MVRLCRLRDVLDIEEYKAKVERVLHHLAPHIKLPDPSWFAGLNEKAKKMKIDLHSIYYEIDHELSSNIKAQIDSFLLEEAKAIASKMQIELNSSNYCSDNFRDFLKGLVGYHVYIQETWTAGIAYRINVNVHEVLNFGMKMYSSHNSHLDSSCVCGRGSYRRPIRPSVTRPAVPPFCIFCLQWLNAEEKPYDMDFDD
jgi:hypothetical protein